MRILNLQISKDTGLRIVENSTGGIDFVTFPVDGHYATLQPGVPEENVVTIPYDRRKMVAEFINFHIMVEDEPPLKPER